jgi:hypothetical protein
MRRGEAQIHLVKTLYLRIEVLQRTRVVHDVVGLRQAFGARGLRRHDGFDLFPLQTRCAP